MFSIIIPTWNNLALLQLCVRSIRTHSAWAHQIVLHINDGSDGTLEWAKAQGLEYTHSLENIGICTAVNLAFLHTRFDYVVYMNDDMYALPDWDTHLYAAIQNHATAYPAEPTKFMFSATMIEPTAMGSQCVINADYGKEVTTFKESELLQEYSNYEKRDWCGSSWPPLIIHREMWATVGGFSIEFSPGMSSDPDLSMKLWHAGVREFRGIGAARVYHFQAKSTLRIVKNDGRTQFMRKWGISASAFYRYYLRMGEIYTAPATDPAESMTWQRLKVKWHIIRKI